ncbi:MAG: ribosome silencing factor [Gloeobacterales cyanobacterium]
MSKSSSLDLAYTCAQAADERKGQEILLIEVGKASIIADYFVVVTGLSRTQVRAIAKGIEEAMEVYHDRKPLRIEGSSEASWILQDFGDVIVHIFLPPERAFYQLEAFWSQVPQTPYQPDTHPVHQLTEST